MLKNAILKIVGSLMISGAFMACGIVDSEAAQSVVDTRAQILEIQTTEVDPLMEQMKALQDQIDPIEAEIEALEDQREDLYRQGEEVGRGFEDEMREKFDLAFMNQDEAREAFYEELENQWRQMDDDHKDQWDRLDDEIDDRRELIDDQNEIIWDAWDDERRDKEDETRNLENELRDQDPNRIARKKLEAVRMELNFQSMEIQEQRMMLDEQLQPLYDQIEDFHRQNSDIWDDSSFEGMDEDIRNRRKLLDSLHDQLQLSWDSFNQSSASFAPAKDWSNYDSEIDDAWNDYHAEIVSIHNGISQAYSAQNDADAAASVKDISVIEQEYVSKISDYNNQVIQIQAEIDAL